MSTVTKVLLVIFIAYVAQSVFAFLQIRRSYRVIGKIKDEHRGEPVILVTGTGRTAFLLIARGYFIIMLVDEDDRIVDFYGMDGYTVFATPRRKEKYIGMTLDEVEASLTKKNEIKAFADAREQLVLLREGVPEIAEEAQEEYDDASYEDDEYEDEYEFSEEAEQ